MSFTTVLPPRETQTPAAGANGDGATFRSDQRLASGVEEAGRATAPRHRAGSADAQVSSSAVSSASTTAPSARPLDRRTEPPRQVPEGRLRAERTRSTKQYLALARPTLVKRLGGYLDGLAAHAQTAAAGVYVFQIDRLTTDAMERFFDDGFLDLLLAVRNALVVNNAWMRYTEEQIGLIRGVVRRYAPLAAENGREFRGGIVELNQLGIDTTPFELPEALLFDEEE